MAVTASGLFYATWSDLLDTTQLAIDLDLETHRVAMFTDTVTPNFSTDTAYGVAPYNANEVSYSGATPASPDTLTTTVLSDQSSGTLTFDADDAQWLTSTITDAMCALIYADALAGDNAIVLVDFVTAASTSNGTFTISWATAASGGIFNIDLTP